MSTRILRGASAWNHTRNVGDQRIEEHDEDDDAPWRIREAKEDQAQDEYEARAETFLDWLTASAESYIVGLHNPDTAWPIRNRIHLDWIAHRADELPDEAADEATP